MSETVMVCILSSTLAATVITSVKELILWFLNRRAKVQDDEKENIEEQRDLMCQQQRECMEKILDVVEKMAAKMNASIENDKIILRDKIHYLVLKYVDIGEITLDEKQAIHHMWNIYHYDLGGNGDLDDEMDMLENIPVVRTHTVRVR